MLAHLVTPCEIVESAADPAVAAVKKLNIKPSLGFVADRVVVARGHVLRSNGQARFDIESIGVGHTEHATSGRVALDPLRAVRRIDLDLECADVDLMRGVADGDLDLEFEGARFVVADDDLFPARLGWAAGGIVVRGRNVEGRHHVGHVLAVVVPVLPRIQIGAALVDRVRGIAHGERYGRSDAPGLLESQIDVVIEGITSGG